MTSGARKSSLRRFVVLAVAVLAALGYYNRDELPIPRGPGSAQRQSSGEWRTVVRVVVENTQGDIFDPERIDLSLKTLFATGLFADVQIEQRGADLVVSVIENPIINRVIFEGMNTLDNSIAELYFNGMISREDAVAQATYPEKLERMLAT